MSENGADKQANGPKRLREHAAEKGPLSVAVVIASVIVSQTITPAMDQQTDELKQTFVRESDETTESIDRFAESQRREVSRVNETLKDLNTSLGQVTNRQFDIDARVRDMEDDDLPRIEGRIDRLEGIRER